VPFSSATRTQTALAYVRCSCAARIPKRTGSRCEPSRGVVDGIDWAVLGDQGPTRPGATRCVTTGAYSASRRPPAPNKKVRRFQSKEQGLLISEWKTKPQKSSLDAVLHVTRGQLSVVIHQILEHQRENTATVRRIRAFATALAGAKPNSPHNPAPGRARAGSSAESLVARSAKSPRLPSRPLLASVAGHFAVFEHRDRPQAGQADVKDHIDGGPQDIIHRD